MPKVGRPTVTSEKRSSLADYDRPPVNETVYGVKFAPLSKWKLPHVGAFWERVRDQFPQCEHAQPIADTDFADSATGLPVPRVWLISASDDRLIQLQPGRFHFNWRKRESAYPRYEILSESFFGLFGEFRKFVGDNSLGDVEPQAYELTYINHIFPRDGWKLPDDLGKVVPQLSWQNERYKFLPHPSGVLWQARFSFADGPGTLSVKVVPARHAKKEEKEETEFLLIELTARGLPAESPLDGMADWFSRAHEWIVRGFEDLTTAEAQRELWGKHE